MAPRIAYRVEPRSNRCALRIRGTRDAMAGGCAGAPSIAPEVIMLFTILTGGKLMRDVHRIASPSAATVDSTSRTCAAQR